MKVLRFKVGRVPCITRWWYECHSFDPLIIAVVPEWWLPYCWRWWMLKTEDCCETSRPFSWQRLGMGLILICFWEIIFYFFYVPMRFTNTRWCVGQVEPVRVSTTVDTGIILRGLLCLVQVEAYVQTDVLHPERSFTVVGFQTTVYVRTLMAVDFG